jgi:hypothetical protein
MCPRGEVRSAVCMPFAICTNQNQHLGSARVVCALSPRFINAGFETQRVSVDPRAPRRVFKGLHGSNVKAIMKP